ncbi:stalk domain-containing protein [Gorillibacterium sp. sgz500922]|uniref:copper amine oxidase N-terminal domain-containing protein n=1 Tax=Gorillibacterium sp. sgz500922 TaxID=3446694 RepID=UPI003F67F034
MKKNRYRLWIAALCGILVLTSFAAVEPKVNAASASIKSVLADGTMLLADGSIVFPDRELAKGLGVVRITGTETKGYGITDQGALVRWTQDQAPALVPDVTGVKQVTMSRLLKTDGSLWAWNGDTLVRERAESNIVLMDDDGISTLAALSSDGAITLQVGSGEKPIKLERVNSLSSVRKIAAGKERIAVLFDDGEVMMAEVHHLGYDGEIGWNRVTGDGEDIAFLSDSRLAVVLKGGNAMLNRLTSGYGFFELSQYPEAYQLKQVVSGLNSSFYGQRYSGEWVYFHDKQITPVDLAKPSGILLTASATRPKIGDAFKLSLEQLYDNGRKAPIPLDQAAITVDKPHLVKALPDGTFKATGVGDAVITAQFGEWKADVKISPSLRYPLETLKEIKGVTYLPLVGTVQALGGTYSFNAKAKTFTVLVGSTSLILTKGSDKVKVGGKTITMKGSLTEDKGVTLLPAGLLTTVFGAKLSWNQDKTRITVTMGSGSFAATYLYAAYGSGQWSDWLILMGYPAQNQIRLYFRIEDKSVRVHTESLTNRALEPSAVAAVERYLDDYLIGIGVFTPDQYNVPYKTIN